MSAMPALKIAVVAGEESGDLLGADVVRALAAATGREVRLVGLGGRHLQALGLTPLFPASEIALMGLSAIIRDLPRLIRRIGQTAHAIASEKPDCLITIDSPDFSLRVARKVRAAAPGIPIIHYVCPSVWAWRPGRAAAMRPYVDHILCLLPFEPAELERLGGPPGSFVGHRLVGDAGIRSAANQQMMRRRPAADEPKTILLLPGSRTAEVKALIGDFGRTVDILRERGNRVRCLLPTTPHLEKLVRNAVALWPDVPEIIVDTEHKWQAFGEADAALIASGTVSLELALAGVPMISCYRLDPVMRTLQGLVTVWSASLPNIIADRTVVPEHYNQYVRPAYMARQLESLATDTPARQWQLEGFAEIARRMATGRPAGKIAADAILKLIEKR